MRVLRVYHAALEPGHSARDEALGRAGVDLTLVAPTNWPGGTAPRPEVTTFEVRRPGDINRHTYLDPAAIADLAVARRVELIDVHEEPFSAVTRQLLHHLPGIPVVAYSAQNIDKRWPPPFHQWQRAAFRRIEAAYPCSRQAASVLRGAGFTGEVSVLPLGVELGTFAPGEQVHDAEPFTLGIVGRLVPEKGISAALTVLEAVSRHRPSRLLVIGDGPARAAVDEYAGPGEIVTSPWLSPPELARRYRAMHVVLVPSVATRTWVEQFGRTVIEGRACGAVAAGYASGSLPEVIGGSGVVAPAGATARLAAAVVELATDSARWQRLRTAGLREVIGWDDVAAQTARLYARALGGVPRQPAGREHAVTEFGPPAQIDGGGRPFAVPLLRQDTLLSRTLAETIDRVGRVASSAVGDSAPQ